MHVDETDLFYLTIPADLSLFFANQHLVQCIRHFLALLVVPSLTEVAFYSSIIVLYFLVTVVADTFIILSILVLTYLQFLICFMLFFSVIFC